MSKLPTIGVICGSHRNGSQTGRVSLFIEQLLTGGAGTASVEPVSCDTVWRHDLSEHPLPLWSPSAGEDPVTQKLAAQLQASDAFVILTPEWHGMVPAALKNFFLFYSGGALAHKPALAVAVSGGMGGSYPIAELRMSSYKNSRICYLPEHIIVRDAEQVLHDNVPPSHTDADAYLRRRIPYALKILHQYALALRTVRDSGDCERGEFGNGM